MAKIVTITNPLTGQPAQVDQLDHTAQQIDDGLNIARGVSNPNLLDNWYFGNPVNQRNVSGVIDAVGYFLDRWKLVSGSVTIGSNGITLNGTIAQILETAVGTDVTASALTTEGVVVASYDNNSKTISLTGTGQTFVAAKLELGSAQTLAHQENGNWVLNEIPDFGEQMARCQRFRFQTDTYWGAAMLALNTFALWGSIQFPVTMRKTPGIEKVSARNMHTGAETDISAYVVDAQRNENGITYLSCYGNDVFTTNNWYQIKFSANADL